jgi:hypothetical protein
MLSCALRNVRSQGLLRCCASVRCSSLHARCMSATAMQSAVVARTSAKEAAAARGTQPLPCCKYKQVRTLSAEQSAAASNAGTDSMSARDYWCAAAAAVASKSGSWRSIHYKLHRAREEHEQQQQQKQQQQQRPQRFVQHLLPSALTRVEQIFTFPPEQEQTQQQSKVSRARTKRRLLNDCNAALLLYEAALRQIAVAQRSGHRKQLLQQYMKALEACVVLQAYDAAMQLVAGMQRDKLQVTEYAW